MYQFGKRNLGRARRERALCPRGERTESQKELNDDSQVDIEDSSLFHSMGSLSVNNTEKIAPEQNNPEINATSRSDKKAASKKISVKMGESVTVKNDDTVLSTRGLSDCCALAVLSGWDGVIYKRRTLMHLKGGSLDHGLNNEDSIYILLTTLEDALAGGGVVILVAGDNSHSDVGIRAVLEQKDRAGEKPFFKLLTIKSVNAVVAGSSGIKIMADGKFELREGSGRGILRSESIEKIFDEVSLCEL
jgi:hypothetical protein